MKLKLLLVLPIILAKSAFSNSYFPKNYDSSRTRFLNYSQSLKGKYQRVESFELPVGSEELHINSLYIPAQKKSQKLIIITSGNHGPEGYAGSALQAMFIEEVLPQFDLSQTGILFVHALNPWGFKHHRRGTENNVNLNRNFDVSPELFSTTNDGYDQFKDLLERQGPVSDGNGFVTGSLLWEMISKKAITQQSLTEAIGKGQYTAPKGINYGGEDFEPQTKPMMNLLKKVAQPYQAIFHIDLHTGLGKKNTLHIMTKRGMNEASLKTQSRLFQNTDDKKMYEITPPEAEGFYEILGDYADVLRKMMPEKERVIVGITAEFGTVGNGLVGKTITINRLILENQGYYFGYTNGKAKVQSETNFLELFYPKSEAWKNQVLEKGRFLFQVVAKRFIDN